jgi:hypothetical protein
MTENIQSRLTVHEEWVDYEYDEITLRVASMKEITSWEGWDEIEEYPPAKTSDVSKVEALLIFSHQPFYNQRNKYSMDNAKDIRIFNTGKIGKLLPEVSYRYHNEDDAW